MESGISVHICRKSTFTNESLYFLAAAGSAAADRNADIFSAAAAAMNATLITKAVADDNPNT
jgi:hypothetical protein